MRERFRNWMRTPSLRGQLIWLSVSSVLVTLLISLMIMVLLISNVMGPFVNREAEFAMQTVSRSLSTKTQLLEDILLRICKSPQMTGEASDARGEQFRSLVDIYSDKNIVAPGLPFVEMAYFMDMRGSFDVVSYHEQLSSEHYAVGFKKGDEASATQVTDTLKAMDKDGFVKDLCDKYADQGMDYANWCLA